MSFVSSFVYDVGNTANSMLFTALLVLLAQTKLIVLATKQNKALSSTVSVSDEEDANVQFPREPLMANLYDFFHLAWADAVDKSRCEPT